MSILLTPLAIGSLTLRNRIIMAPLTRCRAGEGRVPTALMAQYYAQRADAGLIISEAIAITPEAVGFADTPGLWSAAQVAGWKLVTEAVHQRGGLIFAQLWFVGRVSHPVHLNGDMPVSASAVQAAGHVPLLRPKTPYVMPRALGTDEIAAIVGAFGTAAANAKKAGFDGVELHGANGYLIEQFLSDKTNLRRDAYGGSVENRSRFLSEIIDALKKTWPGDRIGLHLSPRGDAHDSGFTDAAAQYGHVADLARAQNLAFLCIREAIGPDSLTPMLKARFGGIVIANEKLSIADAEQLIHDGKADAAAWGTGFIANPDLVSRIRTGAPWNEVDWSTCYGLGGHGPKGYTDYPALECVA